MNFRTVSRPPPAHLAGLKIGRGQTLGEFDRYTKIYRYMTRLFLFLYRKAISSLLSAPEIHVSILYFRIREYFSRLAYLASSSCPSFMYLDGYSLSESQLRRDKSPETSHNLKFQYTVDKNNLFFFRSKIQIFFCKFIQYDKKTI